MQEITDKGPEQIVIAIAGNKCDLEEQAQIQKNEAEQYAKTVDADFNLTSAKQNTGIQDIFLKLSEKLENSNLKLQAANLRAQPKQITNDINLKSKTKEPCC
eukprot:TRINITY_DN43492_c0_g1_i1.p2 TRINITY_DN43492_c0_g1~~TRINITY_DN43492_c0_g1_i1.p2  ORF type:complete len:102 (-),score=30.61 TRINITY_DN43492_c0_g1_i1:119-424(-)